MTMDRMANTRENRRQKKDHDNGKNDTYKGKEKTKTRS